MLPIIHQLRSRERRGLREGRPLGVSVPPGRRGQQGKKLSRPPRPTAHLLSLRLMLPQEKSHLHRKRERLCGSPAAVGAAEAAGSRVFQEQNICPS